MMGKKWNLRKFIFFKVASYILSYCMATLVGIDLVQKGQYRLLVELMYLSIMKDQADPMAKIGDPKFG